MTQLLLNADVGESFGAWRMGQDEAVIPHVHLANIACGFHASDPDVMRSTIRLAKQHQVKIGAHPAYPDLQGFGRRSLQCSPEQIENLVLYQLGALQGLCRAEGTEVTYVKPHGALYNDMMKNEELLRAILRGVKAYSEHLPLMIMSTADNSRAKAMAEEEGMKLMFEAFADRAYDDAGFLVSRRLPNAVHHNPETIIEQATRIALKQPLLSNTGKSLHLEADTLCVHGDNEESIAAVKRIRAALDELG
ncbi:LamB/YcsF family protein [Nitrincola tibetensis]|uniref:5-oxoprolinase subunit A n=1 Tax=Nitrincola tibetensis TaxID=2219697 RepID=A0A364NPE6_9GAMM|nr:5-oxoprolinase subunit PxpA [Nitrincola tibetensis]RAU18755.1 LamB/YcsF family protein [Nitrincola tibetensis]